MAKLAWNTKKESGETSFINIDSMPGQTIGKSIPVSPCIRV